MRVHSNNSTQHARARALAGASLALVLVLGTAVPAGAGSIGDALREGTWEVDMRYRFERVDADAFLEDGDASTLRTVVLYRSGWYNDFRLGVTIENVTDIGFDKQHNDGSNGIARPLVPDAELTEIDEAWLAWRGLNDTTIAIGTTRLAMGNQRFVGPVGFRQSNQSFDGASLRSSAIPRTTATYARLRNVNRVNGSNLGLDGNVLYAEVDLDDFGTFAPYWYELDFEAGSFVGQSTSTIGGAWTGGIGCCKEWSMPFRAEYATQSDTGDNPADIDADYMRFELGGARDHWSLTAIWETLSGGTGGTFTTPLATLHAFNGWADIFQNGLPAGGLEDRAAKLAWSDGPWKAAVIYHDFIAEDGDVDYGTEFDAQIVWESDWGQQVGFTMAAYDADQLGTDVTKLWLWSTYRF